MLSEMRYETKPELPWVLLIRDNTFYSTGMYLERALQRLCNVITLYFDVRPWINLLFRTPITKLLDKLWKVEKAPTPEIDMVLVVDPVRRRFNFSSDVPTAYYAIDSHVAFHEHLQFARVQDYDFVFVAQKDDIPKYRKTGCKEVHWLPLACDPDIHKKWKLPTKYDICFIGKAPPKSERWQIIKPLKKEFNVFFGHKYLHDMARIYSQSKIVLNKSLAGDLNMRMFEAMSCGRLLLTDRIANGLEELFTNKKHLVIYDDLEDLARKIRYYLKNTGEREKIAIRGQREVHRKHTYLHRAAHILSVVLGYCPSRRFQSA